MILENFYESRDVRVYKKIAPTIRAGRSGLLVMNKINNILVKQATKSGWIECEVGGVADLSYPTSKTRRGRVQGGGQISPTITAETTGICRIEENEMTDNDGYTYRIRKLTPWECWRLMDIAGKDDENYKKAEAVNSNTQLFKQAGNGIVRSVLMGIFSQLGIKGIKKWNDMTDDEIYNMVLEGSMS